MAQAALADVCAPVQGKAWEQAGLGLLGLLIIRGTHLFRDTPGAYSTHHIPTSHDSTVVAEWGL